jgi:hypothetical protein
MIGEGTNLEADKGQNFLRITGRRFVQVKVLEERNALSSLLIYYYCYFIYLFSFSFIIFIIITDI